MSGAPALRPQAREAGVSRSPGPCRPERGPAGGRGGLRRLSGDPVSPPPPRPSAWGLRVSPHPAALVPRTPPRGEAPRRRGGRQRSPLEPSPAATPVVRAPSPPFPSVRGCRERVTPSPAVPWRRGKSSCRPPSGLSPPSPLSPPPRDPPCARRCRRGARRGCSPGRPAPPGRAVRAGGSGQPRLPARGGEDPCLHPVPFLWPDLRSLPGQGMLLAHRDV